mmetsp:Transcript_23180/g.74585  ORF Transcript_23180/g.74585 Transcript_23180/m.74585 type:complete len:217 (+) Transcript_23180:163-813(+)
MRWAAMFSCGSTLMRAATHLAASSALAAISSSRRLPVHRSMNTRPFFLLGSYSTRRKDLKGTPMASVRLALLSMYVSSPRPGASSKCRAFHVVTRPDVSRLRSDPSSTTSYMPARFCTWRTASSRARCSLVYARRARKPRTIFWIRHAAMALAPTLENTLAHRSASSPFWASSMKRPPRISSTSKQRPSRLSGYHVITRKLSNGITRTLGSRLADS